MPEAFSCRLLCAGRAELGPWWDYELHAPWWRMYRNDQRGARLGFDGGALALEPGRTVIVPAWSAVRSSCPVAGVGHLYLHLDLAGLPAAWVRQRLPRPVALRADPVRDALLDRCGEVESPDSHLRAQAAGALALADLLSPWRDELEAARQPPDVLAPAFASIADVEGLRVSVAFLARQCGLSADHFTRRFRAEMGISPARWLLDRRLDRVAERLATTSDGIDAIADEAGFADRFHLSRAFRSRFGVPPASYRNTQDPGSGRPRIDAGTTRPAVTAGPASTGRHPRRPAALH